MQKHVVQLVLRDADACVAALRTVIDTERLAGVGPYHAIRSTIST
jgi:hypothetical protein